MKLNLVLLFFFTITLVSAAEVSRIGSDLTEKQIASENDSGTQKDTLEKLWRAMKHRFGQKKDNMDSESENKQYSQINNQQEKENEDQLNEENEENEENEQNEDDKENTNDLGETTEEEIIHKPVNQTIEQKNNEEQTERPVLEDRPNQMAPITKALLYIRPKRDERWVMLEEGLIKWAISSYLQPYASEILMNCNLYRDGNMILSVFRGVPLNVGTESWTPPGFLEPAPNYQLRLWSQPSRIGLIDEYSMLFSIVPSADDVFMFNSDPKKLVGDNLEDTELHKESVKDEDDIYQPATTTEPTNHYTALTPKFMPGYNTNTGLPGAHNFESNINFINQKQGSSASNSPVAPNMPTGIYALYPSLSIKLLPVFLYNFWISTAFIVYFLLF